MILFGFGSIANIMDIIVQLNPSGALRLVTCYGKGLLVSLLVILGRRDGIQETEASRTSPKQTGSRWKGNVPDINRTDKEDRVSSTRKYILLSNSVRLRLTAATLGTTYLDHAGTTPFPRSLMQTFSKDMISNLFGNPHSHCSASSLSTVRVEAVRSRILKFFRASPEHFDVVFTANATAAVKLVVEGMRDYNRGHGIEPWWYGYHADSHTSLVGVREVASAGFRYFGSDAEVEDWLSNDQADTGTPLEKSALRKGIGLFAYPAQSNLNGRRLPLSWPGRIRASHKLEHHDVYSLLDAAAFVATSQLDLSDPYNAPDFTALSFYKIFGFPDLGALIVRNKAGHILCNRPYFGGGTVDMVINVPGETWHAKKDESLHEILEDGTLPFHSIMALDSAMEIHQKLYGSMDLISEHTCALAKILYDHLSKLRHASGMPVCTIYKHPASEYGDKKTQGPTIAFNVKDSSGAWVGKSDFENLAIVNNIQIRTGGVCNPGGIAWALDMSPEEMRANFNNGLRCGNFVDVLNGKPTGIIRVSLGAMSSMEDVKVLMSFMQIFVEGWRDSFAILRPLILGLEEPTQRGKFRYLEKPAPDDGCSNTASAEPRTSYDSNAETLVEPKRRCPIPSCRIYFDTSDDLLAHFQIHRISEQDQEHPGEMKRLYHTIMNHSSSVMSFKRVRQAFCL